MSAGAWAKLVGEWQSSGEGARDFAGKRGVAESSLRWWKTELARRARKEVPRRSPGPRQPESITLARVVREGEEVPAVVEPANSPVLIVVGSVRIVVQHDFDAQLLREVVQALVDRP